MRSTLDIDRTRLHETAHVAVALSLGLNVVGVTVGDDPNDGAMTAILFPPDLEGWRQTAIVAAAGVMIDRRLGTNPARHRDDLDRIIVFEMGWVDAHPTIVMPDVFKLAAAALADPIIDHTAGKVFDMLKPGTTVSGDAIRKAFVECGGQRYQGHVGPEQASIRT